MKALTEVLGDVLSKRFIFTNSTV